MPPLSRLCFLASAILTLQSWLCHLATAFWLLTRGLYHVDPVIFFKAFLVCPLPHLTLTLPGLRLSLTEPILYMGSHWPRAGPAEAAPPSAKIRGHLADVGTNLVTITKVWTLQDIVYRRQLPLQEPEGKHSPVRGGWESSFLPGGEGSTKGAGWLCQQRISSRQMQEWTRPGSELCEVRGSGGDP